MNRCQPYQSPVFSVDTYASGPGCQGTEAISLRRREKTIFHRMQG